MLEPWNDKLLLPPVINTFLFKGNIGIKNLENVCSSIIRVLSKQSPLHKESAILSRFIYKFDKKFRNDKGYKYLKKVNSTLRKYLSLNLMKVVQNFMDMLPGKEETTMYAPTRQMLEYVLVRLMTFSKLMYRIALCSKQAAIFYLDRIKRGESHWMCLMPYALLSRLWSMALVLLQHSCNWYKQLHSCLNKLVLKGLHFLPDQYKLPSDLEEWIDMKHLDEAQRFEWTQKMTINVSSFVEDSEGDLCENILKYVETINRKENKLIEKDPGLLLSKFEHDQSVAESLHKINDDEGVAISRKSFNLLSPNISVKNPLQNHSLKYVRDINSLKDFVNNEERLRNEDLDKSLTGHLGFMQWQTLKNSLLKLNDSVNKKKFEKNIQNIWTEKCLEYIL